MEVARPSFQKVAVRAGQTLAVADPILAEAPCEDQMAAARQMTVAWVDAGR